MKILETIKKTKQKLSSKFEDFVSQEHNFSLHESWLNWVLNSKYVQDKIIEHKISNLKIELIENKLILTGNFEKEKLKGKFKTNLEVDKVIWDQYEHTIFIKISESDLKFDKSLKGVLAAVGFSLCKIIFGVDFLFDKAGCSIEKGVVRLNLESFNDENKIIQTVIKGIIINKININNKSIDIIFNIIPNLGLKSLNIIFKWWMNYTRFKN